MERKSHKLQRLQERRRMLNWIKSYCQLSKETRSSLDKEIAMYDGAIEALEG